MKTTTNHYREELIGCIAQIIHATNKNHEGYSGTIIDETRNLLILECNKKFVKHTITVRIHKDIMTYDLEGIHLVGRPEDRLKK